MNLNFVWDYNVVGRKMARYCHKLNGILLTKLFWPIVGKNCSSDREKPLKFEAEGQKFLVTNCFFN